MNPTPTQPNLRPFRNARFYREARASLLFTEIRLWRINSHSEPYFSEITDSLCRYRRKWLSAMLQAGENTPVDAQVHGQRRETENNLKPTGEHVRIED